MLIETLAGIAGRGIVHLATCGDHRRWLLKLGVLEVGLGRVALGVVVVAVPLLLPPHGTPMEEPDWVREGELRCNGPADLDGQPQAEVGRLEPDVLQSDSMLDTYAGYMIGWNRNERVRMGSEKPSPRRRCQKVLARGKQYVGTATCVKEDLWREAVVRPDRRESKWSFWEDGGRRRC